MDLYTSVDCYDNMARSKYATKEEEEAARAECDRMKVAEEQTTMQPTGDITPQTAGFGGNKTLMLVVGLGILYFVGKKQKWF